MPHVEDLAPARSLASRPYGAAGLPKAVMVDRGGRRRRPRLLGFPVSLAASVPNRWDAACPVDSVMSPDGGRVGGSWSLTVANKSLSYIHQPGGEHVGALRCCQSPSQAAPFCHRLPAAPACCLQVLVIDSSEPSLFPLHSFFIFRFRLPLSWGLPPRRQLTFHNIILFSATPLALPARSRRRAPPIPILYR